MKVLLVESVKEQRIRLFNILKKLKLKVKIAYNEKDALQTFFNEKHDLYIIDEETVSKSEKIELIKEIRKIDNAPIVVLIPPNNEEIKLLAHEAEANWYLEKPFTDTIFTNIILKYIEKYNRIYRYEDFKMCKTKMVVEINDKDAGLTNKEFTILDILIGNRENCISRERILNYAWSDGDGDERLVDYHIKNIRKKLGKYSENIITKNKVGYVWCEKAPKKK